MICIEWLTRAATSPFPMNVFNVHEGEQFDPDWCRNWEFFSVFNLMLRAIVKSNCMAWNFNGGSCCDSEIHLADYDWIWCLEHFVLVCLVGGLPRPGLANREIVVRYRVGTKAPRLVLGPTLGSGGSFPGVKLSGHEADYLPVYSVAVRNEWSCTCTPYVFIACVGLM